MTAPAAKASSPADLRQKLLEARAKLLFRYPFFGYLVSNLEDNVAPQPHETAGTNGTKVNWSPEFLARITPDDVMFVLAHEALHCALLHLWRRNGRDVEHWNQACDACVNDMLYDSGLRTKLASIRGAKGRSAEEVYEDIAKLLAENGMKQTLDDHGAWSEKEGNASEPAERAVADMWRAALATAKGFGSVPDGVGRQITRLLEPKRDWRDILLEGLWFPEDYQWTPTDRRFSDVLLPTLSGSVHRVVVAVDTSGSIQGEKLDTFWTEMVTILRNNRCEARILACDTEIQNEWDETEFDPGMIVELKGGGGTSFVPVFERVEGYIGLGWRPEAVVYLTDLDGQFPSEAPPGVRVLWVVGKGDGEKKVPFGEVIVVE